MKFSGDQAGGLLSEHGFYSTSIVYRTLRLHAHVTCQCGC